jgi:hypothetical protein
MQTDAPQSSGAVELPLQSRAASITASSVNDDARTVELIFTTGAAVRRFDWWTGKAYIEKLSMDPGHVRLDRLNAGAPLLDTHSGYSLASQLGVVEENSARMQGKKGLATVRFSKRADVEPIWGDVKDRIVRNVSVGYVVHKFEETTGKDGAIPVRTAIDWEPYEISMVPMPADPGAQTRSDKSTVTTYPCQIVTRAAQPPADEPQESTTMEERTESETIAERNPLDPGAPTRTAETTTQTRSEEQTDAQLGAAAEQERVMGILEACRTARMPQEMADRLIKENVPLVDAQRQVFQEMRKRGGDDRGPQRSAVPSSVTLGEDPMVHVRSGIENAICHRLAPQHFQLSDVGRKYRGLTMLDIARIYMQGRGMRVTDLGKKELAGYALGLVDTRGAGYHTTSDFPNLLADVANKTLRAAYEEAPQTFRPLVRVVSLVDFKPVNRVQLGDAPALLEVGEHGEFTSGTVSDGKETYQLKTYGRKFAITRQALINDDTDAFSRVPMMFGRKARVLESNLVWAQITSNPTMGDTKALFHADHGNLQTDGDVISVASLGRARAAMRAQTSIDGDYLNLSAAFLLVPTALETVADQFVTLVTPQEAGKVNPFQGRLQVIAEPRLDANSTTAWYLAASASMVDIIELAYLEGQEGPAVESRVGFDVDGLEIKARLDVAAKVIDWRGLHKDPGEAVS